jgi:hypothetical protein
MEHPLFVLPDPLADRYMVDNLFGGESLRNNKLLRVRILNRTRGWLYRIANLIRGNADRLNN